MRLSKYSYLTQSSIPALVGAVCVGPAPVVVALWAGVFISDVLWLRKLARAGLVNAGREVLAFVASYGPYAAVLALNGKPELSLDFLPAAAILVCLYFFIGRILFYFTLLVRDKLEYVEKVLILRWEIISYLLTLIATVFAGAFWNFYVGHLRALAERISIVTAGSQSSKATSPTTRTETSRRSKRATSRSARHATKTPAARPAVAMPVSPRSTRTGSPTSANLLAPRWPSAAGGP